MFLSVGDPRRLVCGRAARQSLLAAIGFVIVLFVTKETRALDAHTPWQDDPYDTIVSFDLFFMPVIVAISLVRMSLCRRSEPLPLKLVQVILRGARVALALALLTIGAEWVSVVLHANEATWTATTVDLIAVLTVVSVVIVAVAFAVQRAWRRLPTISESEPGADWFADLVAVGERQAPRLGPVRVVALALVHWFDEHVVALTRRHPVAAAATTALAFGLLLAANALFEEGPGPLVSLDVGIGASAWFAFLLIAGPYIDLVRVGRPILGRARRALDAVVAGCAAVQVALGFRDELRWLVGTNAAGARPVSFTELLAIVGVSVFLIVYGVEAALGIHARGGSSA
jgi:hypothetical protein